MVGKKCRDQVEEMKCSSDLSSGAHLHGDRARGVSEWDRWGQRAFLPVVAAAPGGKRLGQVAPQAHRQGQSIGGKPLPDSSTTQTTQEEQQQGTYGSPREELSTSGFLLGIF